jgi:hypothetical protein
MCANGAGGRMEEPSKYLTAKAPHIRFYNGVWRASKNVDLPSLDQGFILEMHGGSPADAFHELQKAIALTSYKYSNYFGY